MIQEDGDICLIDFNISIDGESNKELIGLSSQFASPEQAKKAEMILAGKDGNRIHPGRAERSIQSGSSILFSDDRESTRMQKERI